MREALCSATARGRARAARAGASVPVRVVGRAVPAGDVARSRRGTSWRWKKRRSIAPPSRARRSATGRVSAGHYSHGLPNTDRANTLGIGARDRRDDAAGG
jgi:hypothetical protein